MSSRVDVSGQPQAAVDCNCLYGLWASVASRLPWLTSIAEKPARRVGDAVRSSLERSRGGRQTNMAIQHILMSCDPSRPLREHYDSDGSTRLGAGAFGSVFSAKHRQSGVEYAIKVILKDDAAVKPETLASEISLLMSLDHHNVVRLYEYFEEEKALYLVTELVHGGDLVDLLASGEIQNELEVNRIAIQLMHAIAYCHGKGVVHRDLKMENCLVAQDRTVKVIDFGMALVHEAAEGDCGGDSWFVGVAGTVPYMSPEMVDAKSNHGSKTDIWSAGIILYLLLTGGEHPLWHEEKLGEREMFDRILHRAPNLNFCDDVDLSPEAVDLLGKMLTRDPNKRPSAKEVLDHRWFAAEVVGASDLKTMLRRIGHFTKMSKFEQAVLTVVAHQSGETEVRELERVFVALDKSGEGCLSLEEMSAGFLECGLEVPDVELRALFDAYGVAGTGQIEYTGWLAATLRSTNIDSEKAIKAAFAFFDLNGSGSISREELLTVLGEDESSVFWSRFADIDKTCVTLEEFTEVMHDLATRRTSSSKFGGSSIQGTPSSRSICSVEGSAKRVRLGLTRSFSGTPSSVLRVPSGGAVLPASSKGFLLQVVAPRSLSSD